MQWRIFIFQVIFRFHFKLLNVSLSSNEYKGVQLSEGMKSYQKEYITMMSNFVRTGKIDDFR